MFGKMGDMMGMMSKLKEAQKNIEKIKKEMDEEFITQYNSEESLKVTVSLSGVIKNIDVLKEFDSQQDLADASQKLLNDVLSQARTQYEEKLSDNAMANMPDLSGLMGK